MQLLKLSPGDGYSSDDQHVTTSVNPLPCEEWDNTFGKVYRDLIERGVMAIMPGHIALPAYDEPDENGLYPPGDCFAEHADRTFEGEAWL